MRKYFFSLCLVLSVFLLAGCGSKKNALEGTWAHAEGDELEAVFVFKSGNKMTYDNSFISEQEGTYEIKDNIVTITIDLWDTPKEYKFEIKDNKLTLTAQDKYSPSYTNLQKQ